jgi:hypothetical protein
MTPFHDYAYYLLVIEKNDAHHIEQQLHMICIPLCRDCHQGSFNGLHGQARIWKTLKKTEMSVLNETIRRMYELA